MMKQRLDHFIAGSSMPPVSGRYLEDHDPVTGRKIADVARGDASDVAAAVAAAKQAFPAWRDRRPIERGRILSEIARKIRGRMTELCAIERAETGKPAFQAPIEIEVAAQYFELYGGLVNATPGEAIDLGANYHSYTRREPFGVVGVILPWNAPLNQAGRGIAPALAAGNTVVAKPSEFTSGSLLELSRLAVEECGLPPGVVNVVTGTGPEAGAALVSHRDIRKVAFTGSVRAGREVGKIAAERIIPLTLELGGKSPDIVFADADLDAAVPGAAMAVFANSGQICSAGTRLFVEAKVYDEFVGRVAEFGRKLQVGNGLDPNTQIGPLVSEQQLDRVTGYLAIGQKEGAKALAGGGRLTEGALAKGYFVQPTVFANVQDNMRIAQEEIFGPVISAIKFTDMDELIRRANATTFGLGSGVWTRDVSKAVHVSKSLRAGSVWVNCYQAMDPAVPFGGYKMSGYGRESGKQHLEEYLNVKAVWIKTA